MNRRPTQSGPLYPHLTETRRLRRLARIAGPWLLLLATLLRTTDAPAVGTEIAPTPDRGEADGPAPAPELPGAVEAGLADTSSRWFVELATPPAVEGGSPSQLAQDKRSFRAAVRRQGLSVCERLAFDVLWNGLSVEIDPDELGALSRIPGVVGLYPVETLTTDPVLESGVDLASALAMTGADLAQNELGLRGSGVRVGVIDTGIDYDHPDLGGCFGPGCRVGVGWDFVGDDYSGPAGSFAPAPDADPDDCAGHGTHVAGIIGARGAVTGVAPEVTFGAYRVFGCEGNTGADVMIAAMERALADGMDVINMSIGSARQWPTYPTASAATRLVNAGVVVVASFGNSADEGLYGGSAPALGSKVIGVAAANNTHLMLPSFEAEGRDIPYDVMTHAGSPPTIGSETLVYMGRGCDGDPVENWPWGKTALIERGACSFRQKAANAMAFGATAVVIHNNVDGVVFGTLGEPPLPWRVVGISRGDGLWLRSLQHPRIGWTDRLTPGAVAGGGLVAGFSSHGLSPDLELKPDLTAPGALIYSTWPLEKGGHAVASGTSMASPHVAGAVALLLEAHPNTPPQVVRDRLQNNAVPIPNDAGFDSAIPESVHRQGAGLIDIAATVTAEIRIAPARLPLGESEGGPAVRTLTIENSGERDLTLDLSSEAALATSGTIDPAYLSVAAVVSFDPPTITVPASRTVAVQVTIEAPSAPHGTQFGGYLVLDVRESGRRHRVPFAGFAGDYQATTVLSDTPQRFPWLAARIGDRYYNRPYGASYTLQGSDRPFLLVHLDHQVCRLRFEVYDAVTGRAWHVASQFEYFTRNTAHTTFWIFGWDGMVRYGDSVIEVPDGSYRVRMALQKALGEDDNPDHWEYWDSPVVTLARPVAGATPETGSASGNETLTAPQRMPSGQH